MAGFGWRREGWVVGDAAHLVERLDVLHLHLLLQVLSLDVALGSPDSCRYAQLPAAHRETWVSLLLNVLLRGFWVILCLKSVHVASSV